MTLRPVPDCGSQYRPRSEARKALDELREFFGVSTDAEAVRRALVVTRAPKLIDQDETD